MLQARISEWDVGQLEDWEVQGREDWNGLSAKGVKMRRGKEDETRREGIENGKEGGLKAEGC